MDLDLSMREIYGQAEALRLTYDEIARRKGEIIAFLSEVDYDEIVLAACGSSYWMSMSAAHTLRETLGVRTTCIKSGDALMHPELYTNAFRKPLLILPSRSGTTGETLGCARAFRETCGAKVLSIVEYHDSPVEALSDYVLRLPWAKEASICQTRSCSCLYTAMALIGAFAGGREDVAGGLNSYIDLLARESERVKAQVQSIVSGFDYKNVIALGSGKAYGAVIEGAYIGIEMAQQPANYYGTLEFRHGPIVMANPDTLVVLAATGSGSELEQKMGGEARAHGAQLLAIADEDYQGEADHRITAGTKLNAESQALFALFVLQAFAHEKAHALGVDPDWPKDLPQYIAL